MTTWNGTAGNDTFTGNSDDDVAYGGGGDDTLIGKTGNDFLSGDDGNDVLEGDYGTNTLIGGAGDDTFLITPHTGATSISGGTGIDAILATSNGIQITLSHLDGVETISSNGHPGVSLYGTDASDILDLSSTTLTGIASINGGSGDDTIIGSGASDTIYGGVGNDVLTGKHGNDLFLVGGNGNGFDAVDGSTGTDTIRATTDYTDIGLSAVSKIEVIDSGGYSNVRIVGSSGNNYFDFSQTVLQGISEIDGSGGNDTIIGSSGADSINGGFGSDSIFGGDGADTIFAASSTEWIDGGTGVDKLTLNDTATRVSHLDNVENITASVGLVGSSGDDYINISMMSAGGISYVDGGVGNDVIISDNYSDRIYLTSGNDTITAGGGSDRYVWEQTARGFASIITDFVDGEDIIDLGQIGTHWRYVGHNQFDGYGPEIRVDFPDADHTIVYLDTTGDKVIDYELHLVGHHDSASMFDI